MNKTKERVGEIWVKSNSREDLRRLKKSTEQLPQEAKNEQATFQIFQQLQKTLQELSRLTGPHIAIPWEALKPRRLGPTSKEPHLIGLRCGLMVGICQSSPGDTDGQPGLTTRSSHFQKKMKEIQVLNNCIMQLTMTRWHHFLKLEKAVNKTLVKKKYCIWTGKTQMSVNSRMDNQTVVSIHRMIWYRH